MVMQPPGRLRDDGTVDTRTAAALLGCSPQILHRWARDSSSPISRRYERGQLRWSIVDLRKLLIYCGDSRVHRLERWIVINSALAKALSAVANLVRFLLGQ